VCLGVAIDASPQIEIQLDIFVRVREPDGGALTHIEADEIFKRGQVGERSGQLGLGGVRPRGWRESGVQGGALRNVPLDTFEMCEDRRS
jgi:hypothetical protein